MKKRDGIGFSCRYNVAKIDPMPEFRRHEARVKELKEDFKPEDYNRLISYIADLELRLEKVKGGQ